LQRVPDRQPLREQALLERAGDRSEVLVEPRVVQCQRGAQREVLGEQQVLRPVAALG